MRIFLGIKASNNLQKQILSWQKEKKYLPVRFIKPENLHITLVPPWYENNINRTVKYLNGFNFYKSNFLITLDTVKTAPVISPRLIWAEGKKPEHLPNLLIKINEYLGIKRDIKTFKTHVTIARFKNVDFKKIGKIEEKVRFEFKVFEFSLFESKLSREGAEYKVIQTFKL